MRAYLASLPPDSRRIINKMREAVLDAAPGAVEEISYGFPVFKLDGESIVWCAAWKSARRPVKRSSVVRSIDVTRAYLDVSENVQRLFITKATGVISNSESACPYTGRNPATSTSNARISALSAATKKPTRM